MSGSMRTDFGNRPLSFSEAAVHETATDCVPVVPAVLPNSTLGNEFALTEDIAGVSPDLQTQPELAGAIFNALGRAYINRGHLTLGRRYVERGLEIRRAFYGDEHPAVADSLQITARIHRDAGRLAEAAADIRRALGIHSRVARRSLAVAATLWELAVIQLSGNELAAAERSAREGLEIIEELHLDKSDPHVPRLLDIIARVHASYGEHARAAEIYAKILNRVAHKTGKTTPKYAVYLANFGSVEQGRGNLAEAEQCYLEAIRIYERVNDKHPNLAGFYVNMATLLRQRGLEFFDQARAYYHKSLALNESIWGKDHIFFGYDEASLGRLEIEAGNLLQAARLVEDALRVFRANLADEDYTASALTTLARIYVESHEPLRPAGDRALFERGLEKAEEALIEAIPMWRKELGEGSFEYAMTRALLGRAWFLQSKRLQEAEKALNAAYATLVQVRSTSDKRVLQVNNWIEELRAARSTSAISAAS